MTVKSVKGPISYLRVNALGGGYGPANDFLDAELIVKIKSQPGGYGFQLRADGNLPVGEAMLDLLRDAFNSGSPVLLEYDERPGKTNHGIIRVIREA